MAEISGKITIDGIESKFSLDLALGSYQQWGAILSVMGDRVDLLEGLAEAFADWARDEVCKTCRDKMLNDGEGYDGECGDCADKTEAAREDEEA